ncbi:acyltransferase, partial [Myxococcota bacterium]|nr:acyltransferase [Myxococcota bacterium]
PQWTNKGFFNSAMVVDQSGLLGVYQKTHLFGYEADVYLPGESGFQVFETPAGSIGVMICFDWFFPESARTLALRGAQVIAHPANLVMPYCQRAMFARSLENLVFTITANRCGTETWVTDLHFTGGSIIYDPRGKVLSEAPLDHDSISLVEIDPAAAARKDLNVRNNIFHDRRLEMYGLSAQTTVTNR